MIVKKYVFITYYAKVDANAITDLLIREIGKTKSMV